jgi:hypothetical protein
VAGRDGAPVRAEFASHPVAEKLFIIKGFFHVIPIINDKGNTSE